MLRTLEEKVNPENAVLIVVDVQNDFCHSEGSLAKRGSDMAHIQSMIPRLQRFLTEARQAQIPIIFIRNVVTPPYKSESWVEQRLQRYGHEAPVCEDEWGIAFYEVAPQPGELVVTKHRYSAFEGTDLDTILRSKGVKSLIMTGVATNVCVESTARYGFMKDYYIVLVGDCCGASDAQSHESTLENMRRHFGVVVNAAEVIAAWARLRERVPAKAP